MTIERENAHVNASIPGSFNKTVTIRGNRNTNATADFDHYSRNLLEFPAKPTDQIVQSGMLTVGSALTISLMSYISFPYLLAPLGIIASLVAWMYHAIQKHPDLKFPGYYKIFLLMLGTGLAIAPIAHEQLAKVSTHQSEIIDVEYK